MDQPVPERVRPQDVPQCIGIMLSETFGKIDERYEDLEDEDCLQSPSS